MHAGDWTFALLPSFAVVASGLAMRGLERRFQSLPMRDDKMHDERDRVVKTWMMKPWPDW